MVFNSLQPTLLPNRLTTRGIVSVLLSVAHSEYRSLGNLYTTIKTTALLSAVSLTLIELTGLFSAVPGTCLVPSTRQAQPFKSSEMAQTSRASISCDRDQRPAFYT